MSERLNIVDHNQLFRQDKYVRQREEKRAFEAPCSPEEVTATLEYTKTKEYKDKNFARTAVVVNPAKACQPLGAVMAALGFEKTLPFIHGSQGCTAYFRSHLARHFKEPVPAVSTSMTEDAAVFGGMRNLIDGIENCIALYQPEMIAVCTTCMAEVIGDDLSAFLANARQEGALPEDMPVPFANTPSFSGSHITGYDAMLRSVLETLYNKSGRTPQPGHELKLNVLLGFDGYTGNFAEMRRILGMFGATYTILGDHSSNFDSGATGEYSYYYGGTPLKDVPEAADAAGTLAIQQYSLRKTLGYMKRTWGQQVSSISTPLGIRATDCLLEEISRLSGKEIPEALKRERARIVDAMMDSHAYLHGKRVAMAGDPDMLIGLIGFCLELGMEPVHIVCSNGDRKFEKEAELLLKSSPYGAEATVHSGQDLWHMRSLLFQDPVDLAIGSSHLKFAAKEAKIPLLRVGFPIFDRHHLHRYPIIGYQGALNLLTQFVNTVLDVMEEQAPDHSFDLVR
ncbi:nitrogenase molybdenum-iron protein subunit beta [Paenibacillus peoriae]|uniref:nitrogenase molybdenum-iron protein subunit beta n=1 Tax=Paenibacillus peoriae TaxID=59893 RepID=UPI00096BD396|nr:nitrogenase molybdenum-iron protein subunit beta [Paenibacillus peoriae]OMF75863.1 nitrogenase molybdenum-iron protein subunit beta [Paenibacillus peoriae]OMF82990.1 nitrogenase molybdenum-iron protein subunit beta [Paenibacillus peoriae]